MKCAARLSFAWVQPADQLEREIAAVVHEHVRDLLVLRPDGELAAAARNATAPNRHMPADVGAGNDADVRFPKQVEDARDHELGHRAEDVMIKSEIVVDAVVFKRSRHGKHLPPHTYQGRGDRVGRIQRHNHSAASLNLSGSLPQASQPARRLRANSSRYGPATSRSIRS